MEGRDLVTEDRDGDLVSDRSDLPRMPIGQRSMARALEQRVVPHAATAFRALWAVGAAFAIVVWSFADGVRVIPLVLASAAILWAGLVVVLDRRSRLHTWVAFVDAGLFAGLLLAARWLVPASLVGDGTSWIMTGASVSVLMAGWLLPPWQG